MEKNLIIGTMVAVCSTIVPVVAMGQCSYTTTGSGVMSGPSATAGFSLSGGQCAAHPLSNTNAQVTLNANHELTLTSDYVVGAGGSITVTAGGRLVVHSHLTVESDGMLTVGSGGAVVVESGGSLDISSRGTVTVTGGGTLSGDYNLGVGDGTASQRVTNLRIFAPSSVAAGVMRVNKATITVAPGASLVSTCNTILYNSDIVADGAMYVLGNLDLTPGGANNRLCGAGKVSVKGCVFGGNGAFNHLAQNCTNNIGVCALGNAGVCSMGPVAGSNANERTCDTLVLACPQPLPVELAMFTATPTSQQQVALHWETASEKNSQRFVLERSADGTVFYDNRTVEGAGTTQNRTSYNLMDEQPLPGTSYYRLRQVDFDKNSSYSPVRVVQLDTRQQPGLDVYPGPAAGEWVVSSRLPAELLSGPNAALHVYDALGRVLPMTLAPNSQPGRWALGLPSVSTGIYVVRLLTRTGSFSRRIAQ